MPASTSIMAAFEPLYGTWRILIPAALLKISPARWMVVPLPGEPKVIASGWARAASTTSFRVLKRDSVRVTITTGV
ncbi:hypothetical protein D3C84_1261820 [compost metagenome]